MCPRSRLHPAWYHSPPLHTVTQFPIGIHDLGQRSLAKNWILSSESMRSMWSLQNKKVWDPSGRLAACHWLVGYFLWEFLMMFHYGQTYGSTSILQTTCSSGISQLEMRFFHDAHSKSSVKMLPYQSAERQNDVYHGRILSSIWPLNTGRSLHGRYGTMIKTKRIQSHRTDRVRTKSWIINRPHRRTSPQWASLAREQLVEVICEAGFTD